MASKSSKKVNRKHRNNDLNELLPLFKTHFHVFIQIFKAAELFFIKFGIMMIDF